MPPKETYTFDAFDPNSLEQTEEDIITTATIHQPLAAATVEKEVFKPKIVWKNVAIFTFLHLGALYGIYLCAFAKWQTLLFAFILHACGGLGITAGAHRLWAHRTYKARLPLRILLGIFQTLAVQNHIYEWSRDHRVHHKYAETDADPHNANRGFFFAHMGWLMMKKHPEVIEKGKRMYLKDLMEDPVVYYQRKYYKPLAILVCFVLPTVIPPLLWGESITIAYFIPAVLRYICTLHVTWLVNSVAHMFGNKPYDKRINPSENLFVSLQALGEGFHNYHHTFPQDYATSEFGWYHLNATRLFIDIMALVGLSLRSKQSERRYSAKEANENGRFE